MATGLMIACVNYARATALGVYELLPDHSYTTWGFVERIPIHPWDGPNFVFDMGRPTGTWMLYAIKTRNTGTGTVEVHMIPRFPPEKYHEFAVQTGTRITWWDAPNFDFMVTEYGELICVKRRNTGTGFVEVHVLTWPSGFQEFSHHAVTPIPLSRADNFDFAVTDENRLVAIERAGTASGHVELHFLSNDYSAVTSRAVTSLSLAAAQNLTFRFESFRVRTATFYNLLGITRGGPAASGYIELVKLPRPWTGVPEVYPTPIPSVLAPNFQFAVMR